MKILYIPVTRKIKEKNFINYLKCFCYDILIIIKNFSLNKKASKSTSGYIDSAIHSNAFIFELPFAYCIIFSKILNFLFDGIFVNWKFTNYRNDINEIESKLVRLSRSYKIKKVIIDGRDKSNELIKKNILDDFDFVIKREKNKSISNDKYMSTMLPCTLIDYKITRKKEIINWNSIGYSNPNEKCKYDIFFSGKQSSKYRSELIDYLKNKNYEFHGGLENYKIPYHQFIETIYNSSINLALGGKGEFTFRHLEILASCSLMMSESTINQLDLPLPLKEGEHYVSFKDKDDLIEKIEFYLKNKKIRNNIALNGRKLLEEYYSPKKHGAFILKKIFSNEKN